MSKARCWVAERDSDFAMSLHTAVTLSVLDMLLYRNKIRILHPPPQLVATYRFFTQIWWVCVCFFFLYTVFNWITCFNIFFLVCFFMDLCSGSNVFGFRDYIKQRLWLGSVCQKNFVLLSDDAEVPLRATKPIFKTQLSGAACPHFW